MQVESAHGKAQPISARGGPQRLSDRGRDARRAPERVLPELSAPGRSRASGRCRQGSGHRRENASRFLADMRPTCHAIIVMPFKSAARAVRAAGYVARCRAHRIRARACAADARADGRAALANRGADRSLRHSDGVEDSAREHGITLKLYRPRWLYTHRPKKSARRRRTALLSDGSITERLAVYAHGAQPARAEKADERTIARVGATRKCGHDAAEQRSARNSEGDAHTLGAAERSRAIAHQS